MNCVLRAKELMVPIDSRGVHAGLTEPLSFSTSGASLVVLFGPSASGTTSVLRSLAGLAYPISGSVSVRHDHTNDQDCRGSIDVRRLPPFHKRVIDLLVTDLANPSDKRGLRRLAESVLNDLSLKHIRTTQVNSLDPVQRFRCFLARELVLQRNIILIDEPTFAHSFIDIEDTVFMLRLLAGVGRLIVVATHDERLCHIADLIVQVHRHRDVDTAESGRALMHLRGGDILFSQGEPSEYIYVIESGALEVWRKTTLGDIVKSSRYVKGNWVGALGATLNVPRSATARALVRSTIRPYTPDEFRASFRDASRIVGNPLTI